MVRLTINKRPQTAKREEQNKSQAEFSQLKTLAEVSDAKKEATPGTQT